MDKEDVLNVFREFAQSQGSMGDFSVILDGMENVDEFVLGAV